MKRTIALITVFLISGLIFTACTQPPTEEMNRAQDAVARAENDVNAVTYAGNYLIRARDALTRMKIEADAKRYEAAKNFASEAVNSAQRAIEEGRTGAQRAREEAANLVGSLTVPMAETSGALSTAQEFEDIILDFETLLNELDLAQSSYDEARQSLTEDNFQDAVTNGENARSLLADINGKITEAAGTISRKQ